MSVNSIQAIRGMNDILPEESILWQKVEKILKDTINSYGFREIRMPIVEKTSLFSRAIGEVTDVVEKEMYTFEDRSGDILSLRPEGTAGCVRACLEHGIIHNQEQRLWYIGPMFRHERPQKGRYRQFHQIGCEVFNLRGPDIDAEIIALTHQLWKNFGIENELTLQINSLGQADERAEYKAKLVEFLEANFDKLDEDSKRRTHTNPLRVLDTKDPNVIEVLKDAPKLSDFFKEETKKHFNELLCILDTLNIKYEINERLVRGLDYYNLTVFEWVTTALGSQGTVCGGGRYDSLVSMLGGNNTPAIGFGLGLERLVLLLKTLNKIDNDYKADICVIATEDAVCQKAKVLNLLRDNFANLIVYNICGSSNMKKQFKKADKLNAKYAIVIAEQELKDNTVTIKNLNTQDQEVIEFSNIVSYIKSNI